MKISRYTVNHTRTHTGGGDAKESGEGHPSPHFPLSDSAKTHLLLAACGGRGGPSRLLALLPIVRVAKLPVVLLPLSLHVLAGLPRRLLGLGGGRLRLPRG